MGQTRCGRFGWPHVWQTLTFGALIACVARRLSRRDLEVFRFGTAIPAAHYSLRPWTRRRSSGSSTSRCVDGPRRITSTWATAGAQCSGGPTTARSSRSSRGCGSCPASLEWKYYSHDGPERRERLLAAGLEPEKEETVVVAEASSIAPPPADLELRIATDEFENLAARIFGRRYTIPDKAVAVVAVVDGQPVSGGRVDFEESVEFAGLF